MGLNPHLLEAALQKLAYYEPEDERTFLGDVGDVATKVPTELAKGVGNVGAGLYGGAKHVVQGVGDVGSGAWEGAKHMAEGVGDIGSGIYGGAKHVVQGVGDVASGVGEAGINAFRAGGHAVDFTGKHPIAAGSAALATLAAALYGRHKYMNRGK